jgi:predicted nuclease of restriction endonuclease-like (RecB) superfamily
VRTASGEMSRTRAKAAAVSRVIDRPAADLRRDFPEKTGLSPRNLKHMRAFGEAFPDEQIVQQLVAQLPWGHNVKLVEALKSDGDRLWSVHQAVEHGWSRNVLVYRTNASLLQFTSSVAARVCLGRISIDPGSDCVSVKTCLFILAPSKAIGANFGDGDIITTSWPCSPA